jgi:hypothetical protein
LEDVDFCRAIVTDAVLAYARVDDAELGEGQGGHRRSDRPAQMALNVMSVESLQLAGREPRSTNVRIAPHGSGLTAHWVRRGDGKTPKAVHEPFCAAIARWAMVTQ